MREIYLIRHSEALKAVNIDSNDPLQIQNEKWCLTIHGEKLAKEKSEQKPFDEFDIVISSSYVRAISTAKYFNNNNVLIDKSFNERKFGVNNWDELPSDFEEKQWSDFNYKLSNGESLNEVIDRQYNALINILNTYSNKKILIVGHATAFASLFSKWCVINTDGYKFKNKVFFDGKWKHCESFKLIFNDDNDLIDIQNFN